MNNNDFVSEFTADNRGFAASGAGVMTFEVEGIASREERRLDEFRSVYSRYATENACVNVENFWVPLWGEGHNLYPQEVFSLISENKILPSIIEKQMEFLFGKGPRLYREELQKGKFVRIPVEDKEITGWLESWEEKGYPHYWEYLKNLIMDFYHVKTCISQYHFNRGRRIGSAKPIDALSYVGSDEARLAAEGNFLNRRVKNSDCNYVLVGDWIHYGSARFNVFRRLDQRKPLQYPEAIAFNNDKTFSRWVYAYNEWFKGLYEWIKASNLTPKYLNSYLKNALNAHIHCIIPGTWYEAQKKILQSICTDNITGASGKRITEYKGVRLVDSDGKPYGFTETMMQELIQQELRRISTLMSGEGKNQGKLYATTKWGDQGWEFKEFPGKFQEYFKSVIDYDKRSDQVVLAGKGISSSITNVENDGVLSKSGSDVYYNYVIYLASLTFANFFICKEINRAIEINFPRVKQEGIKLGFWIEIPDKVQEISPADRLDKTVTPAGNPASGSDQENNNEGQHLEEKGGNND